MSEYLIAPFQLSSSETAVLEEEVRTTGIGLQWKLHAEGARKARDVSCFALAIWERQW